MSKPSSTSARALAMRAAFAVALCAGSASSEGVEPRVPVRVVRLRPALPFVLPSQPAIVWQARMLEPILGSPVADGDTLVVAHASGLLVELDANGRTRATLRAGASLVFGPVLFGGRRRLVVTGEGEAVVVLPSGRVEAKQKLSFRELDSSVSALATSDGGVLVSAGARFARLAPSGTLIARGSVREGLRALLEWRGLVVLVERGGRVLGLGHAGDPYELADLGRPVRACAVRADRLLALVGERDLVELDLETRSSRTVWSDPPLVPRHLAVLRDGSLRLAASSNLLVALDAAGHETFRLAQPRADPEPITAFLGDARGTLLVASGGADLRRVSATGDVVDLPGTACPDPLQPTPIANGMVVASCRSGLLFGISGRGR